MKIKMKSPWEILEIPLSSDDSHIKKSYKKKSLEVHPDKIGGDGQEFKDVTGAYNLIKDSKSRATYLVNNKKHSFKEYGSVYTDPIRQYGINGRGSDVAVAVKTSINKSINGGKVIYSVYVESRCGVCQGWGFARKGAINECNNCGGHGVLVGNGGERVVCKECQGVGAIGDEKCSNCNGRGCNKKKKSGGLKLVSGTNDGDLIAVIENKGNYGRGSNGDLYIFAKLEANKYVSLDGIDIIIRDPITISMAMLGGTKKVFVLGKKHEIQIRPGTQTGDRYYVRGCGVERDKRIGDIIVIITVEIPSGVSTKLKELLKAEHDSLKKNGIVGAWHRYISDTFGE